MALGADVAVGPGQQAVLVDNEGGANQALTDFPVHCLVAPSPQALRQGVVLVREQIEVESFFLLKLLVQ